MSYAIARIRTLITLSASVGVVMLLAALPALADDHDAAIQTALTGAANDITSTVGSALPTVLGVAAFLLVISVAWRFFRRFVR